MQNVNNAQSRLLPQLCTIRNSLKADRCACVKFVILTKIGSGLSEIHVGVVKRIFWQGRISCVIVEAILFCLRCVALSYFLARTRTTIKNNSLLSERVFNPLNPKIKVYSYFGCLHLFPIEVSKFMQCVILSLIL